MGLSCRATNAKGEPCWSTSVDEGGLCAFHGRRTPLGSVEVAREAGRVSVERRRERAVERKRSALDWMAVAVEEHGREIVEVYLQAMRKGDWRAAEALMSRIYGKPEETVRQVETNPALPVLKAMSLEEKLELLRRLQGGELADTASALPIVEAVPRSR
jgi:hypothetical protein